MDHDSSTLAFPIVPRRRCSWPRRWLQPRLGASLGSSPATAASGEQTIVKTAAQAGQFDTLLALAKKAGLVGALSGSGPLTLFAPTDAAFKAVPKATLDSLAKNKRPSGGSCSTTS